MAGSLNKVQLIGHLGADPESKSFQNGGEVTNLRIATSESWKDRDGNKQERTQWHQVTIWNEPLGKFAKNYLRKGAKVYVEGQLETRKWQDQSGADRYSTEVVLRPFNSSLISLDKREDSGNSRGSGGAGTYGDDDYQQSERRRGGFGSGGSGNGPNGGPTNGRPAAFDSDLDDDVPF